MSNQKRKPIKEKKITRENLCLADNCAISFVQGDTMLPFANYIVKSIFGDKAFDIDFCTTQYTSNLTLLGGGIRLDLIIKEMGGDLVDVEAQQYEDEDFAKRVDAYWIELSAAQLREKKKYRALNDIYVVFICDKDYLKQGVAVNWIEPTYRESKKPSGSIFHALFLTEELITDPKNELEWLCKDFFNTNPNTMHGKAASDRLEYLRKDGFQPMMTGYNQWVNDITAKARAEGIVEGRAEGAEMERRKIVLRRLSQGDSIDEIVKGLGFEKEDVERFAAEAKTEPKS